MKLLLDEMVSAVVAEQLRARGRDAEAVGERRELRGPPDAELFDYAQGVKRSFVTYNRDDFLEIDRRFRGQGHAIVASSFSTRGAFLKAPGRSAPWSARWIS